MKSIGIFESDIDIDIYLEREFDPGGMDIHKSFYIYYNGLKLGKISVVYSTSLIEKRLAGFRGEMLWFTFSVILVLAIVLVFVINALMKPVITLADVASEIAAGNLDKKIEESGVGEVGILSRNFAIMRDAIKDKIEDLAHTNADLEDEIQQKILKEKKILHQSKVMSSVNMFFHKSMLADSYEQIAQLFIPIALSVIPGPYCFVGLWEKSVKTALF
ncbi:MAG: HAMP domain-containing protein [Desulfobacter sp.]|nr:HAMP domain-containing protein [Desulfobacter sp.]WDP86935.1 MAG: HAMP domain-containing protein [Desulfobacter sp.]